MSRLTFALNRQRDDCREAAVILNAKYPEANVRSLSKRKLLRMIKDAEIPIALPEIDKGKELDRRDRITKSEQKICLDAFVDTTKKIWLELKEI